MTDTASNPASNHGLLHADAEILSFRPEWTHLLTPREVERRYPTLSRSRLARRRAAGLLPAYRLVQGCVFYRVWDIERFVAQQGSVSGQPAASMNRLRCAIYIRAVSLFASDDLGAYVARCEAYQNRQGWQHFTTTVDFGPSNRPWRPLGGFGEVLQRAHNGDFDVLLVPSLSHISKELSGVRHFAEALARGGIQVRTLDHVGRYFCHHAKEQPQ